MSMEEKVDSGVWLRIIGELSTAMSPQRRWRLAHRFAGACFSSIIHENTRLAWPGQAFSSRFQPLYVYSCTEPAVMMISVHAMME